MVLSFSSFAFLLLSGCPTKKPKPVETKPSPVAETDGGWKTYSDGRIRFQYPSSWTAVPPPDDSQSRSWFVHGPLDPYSGLPPTFGKVLITEEFSGHEKRPLLTIFRDPKSWGDQPPLGKPRRIRLGRADCLVFRRDYKPRPENGWKRGMTEWCAEPALDLLCYGSRGSHIGASSALGHCEKGTPNLEVKENAAVVERIFKSIRFK